MLATDASQKPLPANTPASARASSLLQRRQLRHHRCSCWLHDGASPTGDVPPPRNLDQAEWCLKCAASTCKSLVITGLLTSTGRKEREQERKRCQDLQRRNRRFQVQDVSALPDHRFPGVPVIVRNRVRGRPLQIFDDLERWAVLLHTLLIKPLPCPDRTFVLVRTGRHTNIVATFAIWAWPYSVDDSGLVPATVGRASPREIPRAVQSA